MGRSKKEGEEKIMSYQLIIREEAEQDFQEAYNWYEAQRGGLGDEFTLSLDACMSSIIRNPNIYQSKYKGVRIGLTRRFPFGIYYFVINKRIIVIGILHISRNPKIWKTRK